jgi:hypothetical protein
VLKNNEKYEKQTSSDKLRAELPPEETNKYYTRE